MGNCIIIFLILQFEKLSYPQLWVTAADLKAQGAESKDEMPIVEIAFRRTIPPVAKASSVRRRAQLALPGPSALQESCGVCLDTMYVHEDRFCPHILFNMVVSRAVHVARSKFVMP